MLVAGKPNGRHATVVPRVCSPQRDRRISFILGGEAYKRNAAGRDWVAPSDGAAAPESTNQVLLCCQEVLVPMHGVKLCQGARPLAVTPMHTPCAPVGEWISQRWYGHRLSQPRPHREFGSDRDPALVVVGAFSSPLSFALQAPTRSPWSCHRAHAIRTHVSRQAQRGMRVALLRTRLVRPWQHWLPPSRNSPRSRCRRAR